MSDHHHHHHGPTRRSLLAGGIMLLAVPPGSKTLKHARTRAAGARRDSAITHGTTLVHADLHNHTIMSDGKGDPDLAFASMRDAGLDVAALTDHTRPGAIRGLNHHEWDRAGKLADAADEPGKYTAMRGFEWSHDYLGHMNVWFTDTLTAPDVTPTVAGFFDWLDSTDGLGSFNHPGREPGRFDDFAYDPAATDRLVGLEMFNSGEDFLFHGWQKGTTSPLNACLNAGWRTGITGVTDEHGYDWGYPEGRGRTGLWVTENTRPGVQEAMRARRFFAARLSGLRVDATASGVRMGNSLPFDKGDVNFVVDVDRGKQWEGKPLHLQVLRPGTKAPEVVDVIAAESGRTTAFTVPLDRADGDWVVIRVSDPTEKSATPGPKGHPSNDYGVAYTSPWWLTSPAALSKRTTLTA